MSGLMWPSYVDRHLPDEYEATVEQSTFGASCSCAKLEIYRIDSCGCPSHYDNPLPMFNKEISKVFNFLGAIFVREIKDTNKLDG